MIRFLTLLRLKCASWMLLAQAEYAEEQMAYNERRYEILLLELRKIRGRIAALERPEILLRQALRNK